MGAHHEDGQTGQLPQRKGHMSVERLPGHAEGIPTDRFPCFHKTGISDELPDGSQQKLGYFSH